jgi:hypothetical protein
MSHIIDNFPDHPVKNSTPITLYFIYRILSSVLLHIICWLPVHEGRDFFNYFIPSSTKNSNWYQADPK